MNELLDRIAAQAPRAGIFCDFDGCLAPIVPDPEDARAVPGAANALARLAGAFAVVAVVSGRAMGSLMAKVRPPGVRLFGLHGIEELDGSDVRVSPEAERERPAVERALVRLSGLVSATPGAALERKGWALAVHVRNAEDPDAAEAFLQPAVMTVASEEGLLLEHGRRIFELRPRVSVDKGVVVARLIAEHGLRAAVVVGDDTGDVAAFRATDGLALRARIAVGSAEVPQALLAEADWVVHGPESVVELFTDLARAATVARG